MAIGLIIPSNASFCGYFAIASSILCQTAEERDKCLAKIEIVNSDILGLMQMNEFKDFDQETRNKIQELSQMGPHDELQKKLRKLFEETPLEKSADNMSFITSDGSYDSQMPNYNIATPVKILGALIRHQIQNNSIFKKNVKERAIDEDGFMKDDAGNDKFDNIGHGDLAALFKFFHEKDFSCETHPTNQIIMNLQSTDLQNQNCNFSIIFDIPKLGCAQGHYNAIFSSEKYKEREKEVAQKIDKTNQENNNFCYIFKNLNTSIVNLILTSCTEPQNFKNNLEEVNKNFDKLGKLIQSSVHSFSPSGCVFKKEEKKRESNESLQ